VEATRALFDERGMQQASIEQIASAVGIARGLVYRQFSSKEELYVLTVTHYLDELSGLLGDAVAAHTAPAMQAEACLRSYAGFCQRYPAFLDCSLFLMQRPARELQQMVSESVWLRLGQSMARCLDRVAGVLHAGKESGAFELEDPDYTANVLWTQTLGILHLARIRVGVRQAGPGVPALFDIAPEDVVDTAVRNALQCIGAARG
jgi:AcrR family transcriptional regulator